MKDKNVKCKKEKGKKIEVKRREKKRKKTENRYFGHHKDEHITVTHQHSRKGSGSPVQQVFLLPADDVPRSENNLRERDRQTDRGIDR